MHRRHIVLGARDSSVDWGTALKVERSRVRLT